MSPTPGENETTRAATNAHVGRAIGLTESAVSRIRSGTRYPSIRALKRIAAAYAWPVEDQLKLIPTESGAYDGRYADALEQKIHAKP